MTPKVLPIMNWRRKHKVNSELFSFNWTNQYRAVRSIQFDRLNGSLWIWVDKWIKYNLRPKLVLKYNLISKIPFSNYFLQVPDILPNTVTETRFAYKPPYVGSAKLVAKFTSKEIDDVDGFRVFEVAPKPEDVLMETTDNDTIISKSDVVEWN